MGPGEVVVVGPGSEGEVALLGVGPVSGVGPLAQGGLDEAFGFAVGLWGVGASAAVFEAHLETSPTKVVRAVAAAVIGEQGAHGDAVASKEVNRIPEEGDGGFSLLIGKDASEGHARVVVNGDVQGLPAGMLMLSARSGGPPAVALITSAASRKYAGPMIAGDMTASCFTSLLPRLSKRCTAPLGMQSACPGPTSIDVPSTVHVRTPSIP